MTDDARFQIFFCSSIFIVAHTPIFILCPPSLFVSVSGELGVCGACENMKLNFARIRTFGVSCELGVRRVKYIEFHFVV